MQVATIGLDLAKHVFQIHGIDATEKVVVRKQLRRIQVMTFFTREPRGPVHVGVGVGISRGSGETVARSTDIRRTRCSGVSAPLKDAATIFDNQAAAMPPFHRVAPSQ
jgi:hypothetical protein